MLLPLDCSRLRPCRAVLAGEVVNNLMEQPLHTHKHTPVLEYRDSIAARTARSSRTARPATRNPQHVTRNTARSYFYSVCTRRRTWLFCSTNDLSANAAVVRCFASSFFKSRKICSSPMFEGSMADDQLLQDYQFLQYAPPHPHER